MPFDKFTVMNEHEMHQVMVVASDACLKDPEPVEGHRILDARRVLNIGRW